MAAGEKKKSVPASRRRQSTRGGAKTADPSKTSPEPDAEEQLRAVTRERDQLAEELAESREVIALLQAKHAQAVNQIDWVLDSLHNVMDEKN